MYGLLYEPAGAPAAEQDGEDKRVPGMSRRPRRTIGVNAALPGSSHGPLRVAAGNPQANVLHAGGGGATPIAVTKGHYGPYADNLRHVLERIEGSLHRGYGDAEDEPEKQIELNVEASEQAERFLQSHPDTKARFGRVVELIDGFETPYGMELLATVHWVARHESALGADEAVAKFYSGTNASGCFGNSTFGSPGKHSARQGGWQILSPRLRPQLRPVA